MMDNTAYAFRRNRAMVLWIVALILVVASLDTISRTFHAAFPPFQDVELRLFRGDDGEVAIFYEPDMRYNQHAVWRAIIFTEDGFVAERYGTGNYFTDRASAGWTWQAFMTGARSRDSLSSADPVLSAPEVPDEPFRVCVEYIYDRSFAKDLVSRQFCSNTFDPREGEG